MKPQKNTAFINEDFLLESKTARELYHDHAEKMPVIDYHCHLSPELIATDKPFSNITEAWLNGDHYKWRAMRAMGISEHFLSGDAMDREKFRKWAWTVPYTMRNPLYHWTHMELANPFGITDLLDEKNADEVYDKTTTQLSWSGFSPRGLLHHFKVEVVVTTDDPCDDLKWHEQLAAGDFPTRVFPCFRPDKALQIEKGDAFRAYIKSLGQAAGTEIKSLDDLLAALEKRIEYFHAHNGRMADHGLSYIPLFSDKEAGGLNAAFQKVLKGDDSEAHVKCDAFAGYVLFELGKMYHSRGWSQQFHLGAMRNNNTRMMRAVGPDTGFDSIGDDRQAVGLSRFLDRLDATDQLPRTVIYNLNPAYNEVFAAITGNFSAENVRSKVQFGSGWWFLDQKDGMEKQLNALSNMGLVGNFIGMLTDSRSFLSYSRHEYFRRILCNLFGADVEKGLLPDDRNWIGNMVRDICYNNVKQYFSF